MILFYYAHQTSFHANSLACEQIFYGDITLVTKGTLYYYLNRESFTINAGDAIIFKKGDLRERLECCEPVEYYSFNFYSEEKDDLPELCGVLRHCDTREIIDLINAYDKCTTAYSTYSERKALNYFINLYLALYEHSGKTKSNSHVECIKRYIAENIYGHITLDKLADAVFISANYCNTLFKKETGQTITEYIAAAKVDEAKKMIFQGKFSLVDIAATLGYKDYNYFSRVFKKVTGVSPKEFRAEYSFMNPDEVL